ncbi:lytic murein transglycosylase [Nonomuraea guangzhouensis]|uniref:Lytic murein transglycosylase n=1 Tax=Nonomuraea guangzhouensis TaxID=1291555 RepID=A0ABW4GUS7_9ACTN|nr:lytic murein transglycosylase [Nonomuraea guangzhouensis]
MRSLHAMIAASLVIALTGCAGEADGSAAPERPAQATAPSATQTPSPQAAAMGVPAPDVRIPTDPVKLAGALKETSTALYEAIDGWTKDSQEQPPQDVVLLSLHQQRIYRAMARNTTLTQGVVRRLPKGLAAEARDNTTAIAKLLSLARPISAAQRKKMRLAEPAPAERLRGYMVRAEKRFGVEWEVLAAIMLVETKFGRVRSSSSTGAQGPMQFMPGTWRQYGLGGDVHDARDAVLAAANYLKASGAPRDYRRAVFAYNHDARYVDAVLAHARQLKRDARSFYAFYNWQVFVLSARGEVRLTGPR